MVIYAIVNKLDGKRYVGSAINFNRRKYKHINLLNKSKHHSSYLQNSWNKNGKDMFEFIKLEDVDSLENLYSREQWWIDNSPSQYNICKIAGRVTGFKHSEQTKLLLSENNFKGVFGKDNPFSKKCYQYDLEGNFVKEWDCIKDIERILGFENSNISRCLKGKTQTAYKFQWYYEYQGDKIKNVKVRSCKNNTRFPNKLNDIKKLLEKKYTAQKIAEELNISYYSVRGMITRHNLRQSSEHN